MNISLCSKHENLERALFLAEEAVSKEAELLVFPEVFSTGFCYDRIGEVAETASGPTLEALCDFSKEHGCILAGSMIEQREREDNKYRKARSFSVQPGFLHRIRKASWYPSKNPALWP